MWWGVGGGGSGGSGGREGGGEGGWLRGGRGLGRRWIVFGGEDLMWWVRFERMEGNDEVV